MISKVECENTIASCDMGRKGKNYLMALMAAIPVSIILNTLDVGGLAVFIVSCLSIIPLAAVLGSATEEISIFTGPKVGGLLNATMGNIPELFIGLFSVRKGLFTLIKASIVGSIAGNMLLVLGLSILSGGLKYKFQSFDKQIARTNFGLMFLALIGFIIPAAYKYLGTGSEEGLMPLSMGISIVMLVIYMLGLFFSLYTHKNIFVKSQEKDSSYPNVRGLGKAFLYLILASAALAYEAGLLVNSIEPVKNICNIPEEFLGIVIVPVIGNIAEYTSSVMMAVKDKINISLEIAIGSSMQMALFVAPLLVLVSFICLNPMSYEFTSFQLITVACSIGMSLYIFQDGKTNWLEGVELLSTYIILALAYFLMR